MNRQFFTPIIIVTILFSLALAACDIKIDRNEDGSLKIESYMTEESLRTQLDLAISDPLIKDFSVEFYPGYAMISAVRKRIISDITDDMSFRLDLGAEAGHLTAEISDARVNEFPFDEEVVAIWNERLATRLEKDARRNPDSSLVQVVMDSTGVTMVWRVETAQSREKSP